MSRIGFLSHSDLSIFYFRSKIMRALKDKGHEIYAICPKGAYSEKISKEFKTAFYEINKSSINPFRVLIDTQNLSKILKDLNLDLLQTSAHKSNIFGTFAAKKAGIKNVLNLVEGLGSFYIYDDFKNKIIKNIIENLYKISFKFSQGSIFVNDADPDYFLSKNLISKDKVFRIKSVGIDTKIFDYKNIKAYDFKTDKKIVLMVGRALFDKGICEFYKTAEILSNRKDCEFVFVGDIYEGNKNSVTREFLQNKNVKWIKWSDEIKEILKASYVYVLPSYKEGFSQSVLEAMSVSKPCVVANSTGLIEAIKDGENGLICEVKNPLDLAKKIEILLNDENLANTLGQNGRKIALQYDDKKIIEKYMKVYGNFIDV